MKEHNLNTYYKDQNDDTFSRIYTDDLDDLTEEEIIEFYIEEGRIMYRNEWFRYTSDWD